jgi:hypothetical protein
MIPHPPLALSLCPPIRPYLRPSLVRRRRRRISLNVGSECDHLGNNNYLGSECDHLPEAGNNNYPGSECDHLPEAGNIYIGIYPSAHT